MEEVMLSMPAGKRLTNVCARNEAYYVSGGGKRGVLVVADVDGPFIRGNIIGRPEEVLIDVRRTDNIAPGRRGLIDIKRIEGPLTSWEIGTERREAGIYKH